MSREVPLRPCLVRCAAALVALSVALATPAVAVADRISDARAKAADVQRQIDALDTKASIADEDYNQAREKHAALSARAQAAASRVALLTARKAVLQTALDTRADQTYRSDGPLGALAILLGSRTLAEFTWTADVMTRLNEQDAATVAELKRTEADARRTEATLVASRTEAARAEKVMASNARTVQAQLAARTQVLAGLSADIKALIAQEQARQVAAARARYLALQARRRVSRPPKSSSGGPSGGGWLDVGGNPPTSSKGAAAVYWAEKALGSRYVWAAAGPSTFDCSGLTMWAYRHVGVSLPHSSRDQIHYGARVSRANLQPGDLVFFYSPIHHVGMYVGNGYFIEAPHVGGVVQIASLAARSGYVGACRP